MVTKGSKTKTKRVVNKTAKIKKLNENPIELTDKEEKKMKELMVTNDKEKILEPNTNQIECEKKQTKKPIFHRIDDMRGLDKFTSIVPVKAVCGIPTEITLLQAELKKQKGFNKRLLDHFEIEMKDKDVYIESLQQENEILRSRTKLLETKLKSLCDKTYKILLDSFKNVELNNEEELVDLSMKLQDLFN